MFGDIDFGNCGIGGVTARDARNPSGASSSPSRWAQPLHTAVHKGPAFVYLITGGRCFEWAGDERRRKAEHGGVGTPHLRGASGMVIGPGPGEVGTFSWHLLARRRLVGSVSGKEDPGTRATSQCAIGPPNQAGDMIPGRG